MNLRASVVGGMNFDVMGLSDKALMMRDSNIGKITFAAGGVGRNIAEQLARLGVKTTLFTAVSNDFVGNMLKEDCKRKKIDLSYAKESDTGASCYLSIHEPGGDMALAINDMSLVSEITVEYLKSVLHHIENADVCVIDANLSPECLEYLFENVKIPISADPVSCAKIKRFLPHLDKITAFKPNALEAMYLTNEKDAESAAKKLVQLGVKKVIVSLGEAGAIYADQNEMGIIQPEKVFTCQATGAGDAMCAGITVGAALRESAYDAAKRGMNASSALLSEREKSK